MKDTGKYAPFWMPPAPCNLEVRFDAVVPLRGEIFTIPLNNRTVEALSNGHEHAKHF